MNLYKNFPNTPFDEQWMPVHRSFPISSLFHWWNLVAFSLNTDIMRNTGFTKRRLRGKRMTEDIGTMTSILTISKKYITHIFPLFMLLLHRANIINLWSEAVTRPWRWITCISPWNNSQSKHKWFHLIHRFISVKVNTGFSLKTRGAGQKSRGFDQMDEKCELVVDDFCNGWGVYLYCYSWLWYVNSKIQKSSWSTVDWTTKNKQTMCPTAL